MLFPTDLYPTPQAALKFDVFESVTPEDFICLSLELFDQLFFESTDYSLSFVDFVLMGIVICSHI